MVELSPTSDGGDAIGDSSVDDNYGTKKYSKILGLYDKGVSRTLYQIKHIVMQLVKPEFNAYGPKETR